MDITQVAAQMYTVRDHVQTPAEMAASLKKIRQIGYRAVQLGVYEAIADDERVLKDPAPVVLVGELADSSVNLNTRVWASADDYWGIYFDTLEKVKKQFDSQGISIPFPQRDVHLIQQ